MTKKSKTFCPAPFNSVTVTATGRWALCCSSYADYSFDGGYKKIGDTKNIDEWFSSDYMSNIRESMLAGKPLKECQSCYRHEAVGLYSLRQDFMSRYPDVDIKNYKIQEVDIKFGNKCNLRCKMCFPHASSELMKEWRQLGWTIDDPMEDARGDYYKGYMLEDYSWPNKQKNVEKLFDLIKTIKLLRFTGGEPMINPSMFSFLKFCVDSGHSKSIVLDLATNCTQIHPKFLVLAQQFKRVDMRLSIDGIDRTYEYVRYPGNWHKTFENLKKYSEWYRTKLIPGTLTLNFVLSVFNLNNVVDCYKLLHPWVDHFHVTDLFKPSFMSWNHAPNHIQKEAIKSAITLSMATDPATQSFGRQLIQCYQKPLITTNDQSYQQLKHFVQAQDGLRGISINDYLPHYRNFLD